jgi:SAM-dependent methyltransferase
MSPNPHIMTAEEARQCFDGCAETYELQYAHHRQTLPQLIEAAQLIATDTVLDLGCGIGWVAQFAAPLCHHVIAIDISAKCLLRAIIGTHENGLDNVAMGRADITDRHALRGAVEGAKAWTTDLINHPSFTYNNGQRISDITARVPDNAHRRYTVIFLCWVMQVWDDNVQSDFLAMLRDDFLAPNGRIIITWPTPTQALAIIAVGCGLKPAAGRSPFAKVLPTIHEYVGHRRDIEDARHDLRDKVHGVGLRVDMCGRFPDWQALDIKNVTAEIRAEAVAASKTSNPKWQWLEWARQQRHAGMMNRLQEDPTYRALQQERPPGWSMDMAPLHSPAQVFAVLTRKPEP